MLIFSDEILANKLGTTVKTLRRVKKKNPDFPKVKVNGVRSNAYDEEKALGWWKEYSIDAYADELQSQKLIEQSELARTLEISKRLILNWRNNGLNYKKLGDGSVLFDVNELKFWLLNRNDQRTRAYADKIQTEGE